MANLLSWLGQEAKGAVNLGSKVYDQVNPLDSGRSFQTRTPSQAQSQISAPSQAGRIFLPNTAKLFNTAAAIPGELYGTARQTAATISHNPIAAQNANAFLNAYHEQAYNPTGGLFNEGTVFKSPQEAMSGSLSTVAKRVGGTTLGAFGEIAPSANGAFNGAGVPKLLLQNAAYGGVGSIGNQLAQNGKVDIKQTLKDVAVAEALGLATHGATKLVSKALPKGVETVKAIKESATPEAVKTINDQIKQTEQLKAKTTDPKSLVAYDKNIKNLIEQRANINQTEALAIGGDVNKPTPKELAMGEALGMTPKDIALAKTSTPLEVAHPKLSPDDLANLSPKEQMLLASPKNVPLNPSEVNTAANPHKSLVAEVKPRDYGAAIANSQVVSKPIDLARQQWEHSMKQLQKNSPEEYKNFWRSTEDPTNAAHSPKLQEAINRWRQSDNMVHSNSQALGGNTNYLTDHGLHPWQLPPEYAQHVINGGNPSKFEGLNNISRKYRTIAEGEAAGLKLGTDPLKEGSSYLQANSAVLRKAALKQGLEAADVNATTRPQTRDLGNGHTVQLSKEGYAATRGVAYSPASANPIAKGLRTVNQSIKSTLLSGGQFHTINIGALRAAPTLVAEGHPIAAAKGLYGMFRGAFGTQYADHVIGKAISDGTVEKAAQIGMPYGTNGYATEGTFLKSGVGAKTVFGKQIPMMHDQVARSIIADLEKKGVPLDSPEARAAGKAGANMMGEINKEAQNIPPKVSHALSDTLLASQFTHSKFSQLKTAATKGGVAGSYARVNVAANVAATAVIITGLGYVGKQKSDSVRDSLLRALVDPAIATPNKDSKGNTVKLRLPGTDTSDIAKILGIKLVRQDDGHLGVSWNPKNIPAGVEDYARARLAPWLSAGVKVKTNTSFAGKPLYDPNAPAGVKVQQAGTSIAQGLLPIGIQGLPSTNTIKQHLPQGVQDVLNASAPGGNPLVKSVGSSFGVTPTTDTTTGKALDTSRYFDALSQAKDGLNRQEKDALDLYSGSKKNPVTGKYDVQPSVDDQRAKATTLLQNPKTVDALIGLNKKLASQGQGTDPLWQQSKDKITSYLQYQAMPIGGADRSHWQTQNGSWYNPLAAKRSDFFGSLPAGDPNKPAAPIEYPSATPDVAAKQKTFFALPDAASRATYIASNPDLQQQLDKQVAYNNQTRTAQGYGALDTYPTATPGVQKIISTYNALPKNDGPKGGNRTRSAWITAHPQEYAQMTQYLSQASLYGAQQALTQSQFKDTGVSQAGLKDIYNLGQYDIGKQTDANGNTFYTLGGNPTNSKYASSGTAASKSFKTASFKGPKVPKISIKRQAAFKAPKTRKLTVSKIPSNYTRKKLA